ncbi:hypothetical protein [Roseobacter litoralis]|uniref:hypothetical protein n=1 Tax=Roseobacter litoralis TaxID=42443 RepID=UPI002490ACE8|nr:hypothetical protein [Roseobacter litoralis]
MGWTCHTTPPREERAEIEQLVTFENEDRALRPVSTTRRGSVWYLAVEVTAKTDNADPYGYELDALGRYVFAGMILMVRMRRAAMEQLTLFDIDGSVDGAVWWHGNTKCRNTGRYYQVREDGAGTWEFVIYGFGDDDVSVYRVGPDGELYLDHVPINARDRITVNGGNTGGIEQW